MSTLNFGVLLSALVSGRTPLHLAVQFGHSNIVQQLLNAKANVHAEDDTGKRVAAMGALRWASHDSVSDGLLMVARGSLPIST